MPITSIANLMSLNVCMDTAYLSIALQVDCRGPSHNLQTVNNCGPEGIKRKRFASNPHMVHLILTQMLSGVQRWGASISWGPKEGGDSTTAICGRCKCKGSSKRKITQTLDIYFPHGQCSYTRARVNSHASFVPLLQKLFSHILACFPGTAVLPGCSLDCLDLVHPVATRSRREISEAAYCTLKKDKTIKINTTSFD